MTGAVCYPTPASNRPKVYEALCDAARLGYVNHSGVKIGGWPTPIQSGQASPGEFDLQIDMTENDMYGDVSIGYVPSACGGWSVIFECC